MNPRSTAASIILGFLLPAMGCQTEPGVEVLEGTWELRVVVGEEVCSQQVQIDADLDRVTWTVLHDGDLGSEGDRWSGSVAGKSSGFEMVLDRIPSMAVRSDCALERFDETFKGQRDGTHLKGRYLRSRVWSGSQCGDAPPEADDAVVCGTGSVEGKTESAAGSFVAAPLDEMLAIDAGTQ